MPGIEEARKLQGEAERDMKLAQRDAREARQEKEKALRQRDAAEEAKRAAEAEHVAMWPLSYINYVGACMR